MSVSPQEIEVKFTIAIPEIDEAQRLEAERKAREAFIMELFPLPITHYPLPTPSQFLGSQLLH